MKLIAYCSTCFKEHDVTNIDPNEKPVWCKSCGGFVISPSGKMQTKIIYEEGENKIEKI